MRGAGCRERFFCSSLKKGWPPQKSFMYFIDVPKVAACQTAFIIEQFHARVYP